MPFLLLVCFSKVERTPKYAHFSSSPLCLRTAWDVGDAFLWQLRSWDPLGPISTLQRGVIQRAGHSGTCLIAQGSEGLCTLWGLPQKGSTEQLPSPQDQGDQRGNLDHSKLPLCKKQVGQSADAPSVCLNLSSLLPRLPHPQGMDSINLSRWESDSGTNGSAPPVPGLHPGLWTHSTVGPPISFRGAFANTDI